MLDNSTFLFIQMKNAKAISKIAKTAASNCSNGILVFNDDAYCEDDK